MIIFLGDSFTWGQGLHYENWIDKGKSIDYCNSHLPPKFHHESLSYLDDLFRKTHHFPNLVAKHYDRSYYVKPKNGGSNKDIADICEQIGRIAPIEAIDFVVIQFTEFMRDLDYKIPTEINENSIDEFIYKSCKDQIERIRINLIQNNIKNFIFFSWRDDIGNIIKNEYPDYYTPLIYKNKEYLDFETLFNTYDELKLASLLGINDHHLSTIGHQVIAQSIIKKVDTMNIDFIKPK